MFYTNNVKTCTEEQYSMSGRNILYIISNYNNIGQTFLDLMVHWGFPGWLYLQVAKVKLWRHVRLSLFGRSKMTMYLFYKKIQQDFITLLLQNYE